MYVASYIVFHSIVNMGINKDDECSRVFGCDGTEVGISNWLRPEADPCDPSHS